MTNDIKEYNGRLSSMDKKICDTLSDLIDQNLPEAECKIWHAHPVWFLDGNPVVGYSKLKDGIRALFWSGQTFNEAGLQSTGKFKAAERRYATVSEINASDMNRWLANARDIQWDYKNIVKRKGELIRLK